MRSALAAEVRRRFAEPGPVLAELDDRTQVYRLPRHEEWFEVAEQLVLFAGPGRRHGHSGSLTLFTPFVPTTAN